MGAVPLSIRTSTTLDLEQLAAVSARFESEPASTIVKWAHAEFGAGLTLTASFQDCVLIDIASRVAPDIEVVFLDTQYHFPATLDYVEEVRARYDLNFRVVHPRVLPDELWKTDVDACCGVRRVEPLNRALNDRTAWMTGLRRSEAATRAQAPIVAWNQKHGVVKVNPIATWTDLDVEGYIRDHELPVHPLAHEGYPSIGCAPCTKPVAPGSSSRSGRWAGTDKVECGLHE